jgi:hypothetical protein
MSSHRRFGFVGIAFVVVAMTASVTPSASEARASSGQLYVVQAVPDASYAVSVDGAEKQGDVEVGSVLGPYDLDAGEHMVEFAPGGSSTGGPLTATVEVKPGTSTDLVLHLPAEQGGKPVADVYRASSDPLAPDMARVLVAHTATVPPADVQVDGKTVFQNIANGEFATADVPAGKHSAAIVAAGTTGDPLLGPVDVDLKAGSLTMIYAVGSPTNGSMNVISHSEQLQTMQETQPSRIRTGSAGLLRRAVVTSFGPS